MAGDGPLTPRRGPAPRGRVPRPLYPASAVDPDETVEQLSPGAHDRAPSAPPGPRAKRTLRQRLLPPGVVLATLVVIWEVIYRIRGDPDLVGTWDVAVSLADLTASGRLGGAMRRTILRLVVGYGLALVSGAFVASLMVLAPPLRHGLQPLFLGLQSLPGLAWIPLAITWFGFTEASLLFITVIGSVFAVTMGFVDAFLGLPPVYEKAARNMGVRGPRLLVRVTIPAAMPHMVSAAKVGWSFAWRSLVGAEIIVPLAGLGFLLNEGQEADMLAQVVATMSIVLVVGILFDRILFSNLENTVRKRWGLGERR